MPDSKITVFYFARLRESLGKASEELAVPAGVHDLDGLRAFLVRRGGAWASELAGTRPVRAAINQDMADGESPIKDGDEIAFFPPVTGG